MVSFEPKQKTVEGRVVWGVQMTGDGGTCWLPMPSKLMAFAIAARLNEIEEKKGQDKATKVFRRFEAKRAATMRYREEQAKAALEKERSTQRTMGGL